MHLVMRNNDRRGCLTSDLESFLKGANNVITFIAHMRDIFRIMRFQCRCNFDYFLGRRHKSWLIKQTSGKPYCAARKAFVQKRPHLVYFPRRGRPIKGIHNSNPQRGVAYKERSINCRGTIIKST